ncbi:MAG: 4'-phosphopantetheinyl transferase superfamily protein, partial [Acetivibrio ethanolgignens]
MRDISFTEIWSLKESYVKMLGIGIDTDLTNIFFDPREDKFYKYEKYFEKRIVDNYVISYCA